MKFTAAGDMAIQKVLPSDYCGFREVKEYIMRGDCRFFNLETTINRDCFANYFSGGTWLRTSPKVAESGLQYGFNMGTFANNHCMDYSYRGLLETLDCMDALGVVHAGVGRNLSEAASPAYLDLPEGRVALISCCTHFAPGAMAGEQSRKLPGRPGINGLNVSKTVIVSREDAERIKRIAGETKINAANELERAAGYMPELPENELEFGDVRLKIGDTPGVKYSISESDIKRMDKYIEEANFQADYVLISLHTHLMENADNKVVPKVLREFARHCVDQGADCVIGHGPHELRSMEIYREKPIFYSLGDFVLQLENCELAPEEFYNKFGMTSDASMYDLFQTRTRNFTIGLQRQKVDMEAVIPYFEMEGGKLKRLEFMPIELGFGMKHSAIGWPRWAKDSDILERFGALCKADGVELSVENGIGTVEI